MNILVTGASGFTGTHMSRFFSELEVPEKKVFGLFHSTEPQFFPGITGIRCDLGDRKETLRVIAELQPDCVIHLAGLNRGTLESLLRNNVLCTENLLDGLVTSDFKGRILVIGSSAEYGYSDGLPVTEKTCLKPVSDYGISKLASSLLSLKYYQDYHLDVCVARTFNLTGPGQGSTFVCGRILNQILQINRGLQDTISLHSSLDSRRDFIDVRDAVRAYWAIISHKKFRKDCAGQVFNVGSGKEYAISEIHALFSKIFRRTYPLAPLKTTPVDLVPRQVSDIRFIKKTIGWQPEIDLETSLSDMARMAESEA